jgi:hypothetical protein
MKCLICESPSLPFGQATLLWRHKVAYFQCPKCRFVQTEEPTWLGEAYSEDEVGIDVGAVSRNLHLSHLTHSVITILFGGRGRFLDYGAGCGIFVRLMRDLGYQFHWFDRYSVNIFARGFEREPSVRYDLLTAFEVFEHLPRPLQTVEEMFGLSDSILFSTEILPDTNPRPGQWWYFVPESGQHVAIYSLDALRFIARRFGATLFSFGANHLLTRRSLHPWLVRLAFGRLGVAACRHLVRRSSLVQPDFEVALARRVAARRSEVERK